MSRTLFRRALAVTATAVFAGCLALLSPAMASAAFPGKNGNIAYSHQVDNSSAAIYSVSPSGGTPTNLSAVGAGGSMTADFQPAWSADGKSIAFVRLDFQHCSGQIWAMRADGSGQTNLSNDATTANEFNPAYGPDGSIVFVRAAAGTFSICGSPPANRGDLWVRSPSGTLRQLTTGGTDNTPAWSPDGTKIAFTRAAGGSSHIFVINADGSGTPTDLGPGVKPNWSPDGKKIAFAAPGGPGGPTGGPVTVMNGDGTGRVTLNANGTAPVWSPDSTQIAYVGFDQATNSSVIGVMDSTGQNQHNITAPGSGNNDVKPDWQPVPRPLHLSVKPRHATAHQRACFSFRVKSGGKGVAGVLISFAHRHAFSSAKGKARICAKLSAGRHTATASKAGYRSAVAHVRVRRARRALPVVSNPRFTG